LIIGFSGRPLTGSRLIELNGVAGRLDADPPQHVVEAAVAERETVGQRLRDRLDRERQARIADLVDPARRSVAMQIAKRSGSTFASSGM
jgi:hypothetical protein